MKILHVNTEKGWRGGEQQLLYLVKGLEREGVRCTVACRRNGELFKRCSDEGIDTVPLSGNQLLDTVKVGTVAGDFDIVHAHAAKAHTVSVASKPLHGKPVIYTRRVDYLPSGDPLTRLKYRKTEAVVCVVERVREILLDYGIPGEKVRTVYSAVDTELEKLVDREKVKRIREELKGSPVVGNVGALTEQKNQVNFIEAARILLKEFPEAVFTIVGEGPLRRTLEEKIKLYNLEDRIKLLGFKWDIQNYIKAFDIFVLSSDNEGIGGSILQAMVLKKAVVATDVGGVREVVKDGETGILVRKSSPSDLASGISRVLKDLSLRKSLEIKGFDFAVRNFSIGKMVSGYMEIYGEVLNSESTVGKSAK